MEFRGFRSLKEQQPPQCRVPGAGVSVSASARCKAQSAKCVQGASADCKCQVPSAEVQGARQSARCMCQVQSAGASA